MQRDDSKLKGWTWLTGDVDWSGVGARWARRAKDGSWFVLDFTNMVDACGEREHEQDGFDEFHCEVKRVDLPNLSQKQITDALSTYGCKLDANECVVHEHSGEPASGDNASPEVREMIIVDACVAYGMAEPLDEYSADGHPIPVRGKARRSAEALIRDTAALETRRQRPVNRIGSTAAEYGRGDFDSALHRDPSPEKNLVRKLHGLPPL